MPEVLRHTYTRRAVVQPVAETAAMGVIALLSAKDSKKIVKSGGTPTPIPQSAEKFRVEGISNPRAQQALQAAKDWDARYTCNREVVIKRFTDELRASMGSSAKTEEVGFPGEIYLGDSGDARNITLHAMTHACHTDTPTLLSTPIPFAGDLVLGYHGLSLLINTTEGTQTRFTLFEEGMAERNASYFPRYTVGSRSYLRVGELTRIIISKDRYPRAYEWVKTNDVPTFIRAFLELGPTAPINSQTLMKVADIYQESWG